MHEKGQASARRGFALFVLDFIGGIWMQIDTFSFRYGDNRGFMEWFRYNPAQGLWLDRFDGRMRANRCNMTAADLEELERLIRANGIEKWDGFCRLEDCMCSGNSWVLHVTYREGEPIHAMGHSQAPQGFEEGKKAIEDFFEKFFK